MSFFTELKRRNVFKVAFAYIIVGWLIMQAGDTLAPALRLPEWVNSLLAFFLILGFPLAMFFAWAYEMTADGLKKEKDIDTSHSIARVTGQKLNYAMIGLLVIALGYFVWESRLDKTGSESFSQQSAGHNMGSESKPVTEVPEVGAGGKQVLTLTPTVSEVSTESSTTALPDKQSIAVIPFRNRSANEENATFFSDGMHDELLTNLSKIKALKVISRTSVMGYRDTTKNMRQIGAELGVANILEGGVQRAGNTLRINVQLIDATTDEHLWAKVYDRQLTAENIFAIQTEIAREIANALEATLSPGEQEQLAVMPTSNLEAYDNLLLARQLIERGNWQNLRDAQSYLQKVINADNQFVQAYVLLARTYYSLLETGATTLPKIRTPWQQAIQRALSLDESSATAFAAQAQYLWKNKLEGADLAFQKARQLAPNNTEIMTMYGEYLRKNFHPGQALLLYEMARISDPLSISMLYGLARIHEARREFSQALEVYTRIREIAPSSQTGNGPVAGINMLEGNIVGSLGWIFKALAIDPDDVDLYNWVARHYIDLGDYASARQWLDWLDQTHATHPMTLAGMAMFSIYDGDVTASIAYTRLALDNHLPNRWGSDTVLIRALLIWALDQNQASTALEWIEGVHPELFKQQPLVNAANVSQAIDTAQLLQHENHITQAAELLRAAIAAYNKPYAVTRPWLSTGKAQALALLGEKQAALNELRHQLDQGWRLFWRWHTELNPNFESLRGKPEFQQIIATLRQDMARQYEELLVMQAAGDLPPPPGGQTP